MATPFAWRACRKIFSPRGSRTKILSLASHLRPHGIGMKILFALGSIVMASFAYHDLFGISPIP